MDGDPMRALQAISRWWTPELPLARVAVLRAVIYGFVVIDCLVFVNDVIPHGYAPGLYQPTLLGRVLPLPAPSPAWGWFLLVTIVVGCVVAGLGRLPRLAGWTVAAAFTAWMVNSIGYGYVQHDHLALMIAVLVLPTVGRARYTDEGSSEAAGWALRSIQVATVLTYVGSAVNKWMLNGSPWAWANSSITTWALVRRGSPFVTWVLDFPALLRGTQWVVFVAELFAPVVLFLRGRALAVGVGFWMLFHLMTFVALGIHFLPTVVCWAAFLPLERLVPWVRRRRAGRGHGTDPSRERPAQADGERSGASR